MSTKRKYPRAPLKIFVRYGITEPAYNGRSRVIGEGGMYIETEKIFYKGTELIISFKLPGSNVETSVKGKVVWTLVKGNYGKYKGPGMAIQFIDISDETKKVIREYVTSKKEVLEKILDMCEKEHPPMKEINNLLTQTYILDYVSIDDIKNKVKSELEFFSVTPPEGVT